MEENTVEKDDKTKRPLDYTEFLKNGLLRKSYAHLIVDFMHRERFCRHTPSYRRRAHSERVSWHRIRPAKPVELDLRPYNDERAAEVIKKCLFTNIMDCLYRWTVQGAGYRADDGDFVIFPGHDEEDFWPPGFDVSLDMEVHIDAMKDEPRVIQVHPLVSFYPAWKYIEKD